MAQQYNTGLDYLNSVPAPAATPLPPLQIQQGPPPTQQNTGPQGAGIIPALISQAEQAKGGRLAPEELVALGERAKVEHVIPGMMRKGIPQFQVEHMAGAFDSQYARFMEDYLKQPQPAAAPMGGRENSFFNEYIREPGAALVAGVVDLFGGAGTMLDEGRRNTKAGANLWADVLTGKRSLSDVWNTSDDELRREYVMPQEKGLLGKGGAAISGVAEGIREWGFTEETKQAQQKIQQAAMDGEYAELGKLLMENPQATTTQIMELIGGLGVAGKVTKIPKYAQTIKMLSEAGRAGRLGARGLQVLPSAIGYSGQAANQFERQVNGTPIEQLTANPQFKAVYDSMLEMNMEPAEAAKQLKRRIIAEGMDNVLTTSLIANLALPVVPGLGAGERFFAAGGVGELAGKGAVRGLLSGAAREGVEESIASGVEQSGVNAAMRDPLMKGVIGQAIIGGTTGALFGAGVGGMSGRRGLKNRTAETETETETTDDSTTSTPDTATPATPTQPTGPTFSATPVENFGQVTAQVATAVQEDKAAKDSVKRAENPLGLIETANRVAQAKAEQTGTPWAALSLEQQIELTEATAEVLNKSRKGKAFEAADLVASLAAWKTAVNPPAAPSPLTNPAGAAAAPAAPTPGAQAPTATPTAPAPTAALGAPPAPPPMHGPTYTPEEVAEYTQKGWAMAPKYMPATPGLAESTPAEVVAAINEVSATPEQTAQRSEALFLDGYLKALAGIAAPNSEVFRGLDTFNAAQDLYKQGKITTPQELQAFLATVAAPKAPATRAKKKPLSKAKKTVAAPVEVTPTPAAVVPAVETKPAETKAKKKPLAKKPAETKPAETKPAEKAKKTALKKTEAKAESTLEEALQAKDIPAAEAKLDQIRKIIAAMPKGKPKDTNTKQLKAAEARLKEIKEEAAKSPKQEAPAQTVTGAAETSSETAANANQPNRNNPEELQVRISGILEDSSIPDKDSVMDELAVAISEGNISTVARITSALHKADDITATQRQQINALVTIKPKQTQATLEATPDEDIGDPRSLEDRTGYSGSPFPNLVTNQPAATAITIRPKLKRWWKGFVTGKMSQDQMMEEVVSLGKQLEEQALARQLKRALADRVRGADWFEERLARALRSGELSEETVRFTRWLIRKNPNVVEGAGFGIRELNKGGTPGLTRGLYQTAQRVINLASDANVAETTGVHEILHHTERMMPTEIRDGIKKAYIRDLIQAYQGTENPDVKAYLQLAMEMASTPNAYTNQAMVKKLTEAYKKALQVAGVKNLYQYYSTSEYWAVNGPLILQARESAEGKGWVAKAIQWLKEFVETLKDILGRKSNRAIIKGLDSILKTDGQFVQKQLMAGEVTEVGSLALPEMARWTDNIKQGQANAKTFWEYFAQKTYALEQELIRVVNAGGKVDSESDIVEGMVRFNGIKNDVMSLDESEVGSSVYNWVTENWQEFGRTRQEAVKNINTFYHNTHVLERMRVLWLQNVKLGAGREYDRTQLLTKIREGKISPTEGRKELEQLVGQHRLETEQVYAARKIQDYDKLLAKLVDLKKAGIDQKSMASLNALLKNVRERTLARNIQSGFVSEDDPWIKFYDFKWYVPLKGTAETEVADEISDLDQEGRNGRAALARINKQIEKMSGRKTVAESPIEQMLMDMSLAGRRVAEQDFVGTMYNLIQNNRKLYSDVQINVFEGRPKDGYKQTSGKFKRVKGKKDNKTFYRVLPAPGDGFIYHDGDTHYQVILPKDSKMLRGVLSMGSEIEPDFVSKVVGKGTNLLSKLYTTANPIWQTFVALPRDLTYMPTMMGIRHSSGPIEGTMLAARYVSTLLSNTFQLSNLPAAWAVLSGNRSDLIQYAKDHPDSAVAWLRRYESAGGSTNFVAGFNRETIGNKLMDASENDEGIWVVKKPWRKWEEYTSNYASLLENIGRVAAFRTLKEANPKMSDREAAAKVKDFLNYDQTGRASRVVNSYIPFFKVGMTGADAIRKSFRKPDGSYDMKKLAAWSAYFMVLGMSKYFLDDELLGEDDNGERKIKKIKLDTMTQKMLLPGGDKVYGFNYGLGLPQILAAPGVIAGALMKGHVTEAEAGRAYYEMIARNAPVRPAGLPEDWGLSNLVYAWTIGGLIPGVVRPASDIRSNEDAFGRPIHTQFPEKDKAKSDQAKPATPDVWTDIATTMREDMGIDVFPEDLRYLVRNYGGQPASFLMRVTADSEAKLEEGSESMRSVGRVTGAEITDEAFYLRNEVHATLDTLADAQIRLNAFKKKAAREGTSESLALRQAMAADPGMMPAVNAYKALDKAVRAHNKRLREIRADKLRGQTWKDLERKKADSALRDAWKKAEAAIPEED